MRQGILAGTLFAGVACADEVRVDVVFADDFEAAPASVFRIGSIALRDPHVFYFFFFCIDGTDELNSDVQQQLDADQLAPADMPRPDPGKLVGQ